MKKTLALAAGLALGVLAAGPAPACSVGAANLTLLSARSDIVAIGTVKRITEQVEEEGPSRRTSGVARFVATDVIINRTTRSRPFQFEYAYVEEDGCIFGSIPPGEGSRVKIFLRESATLPRKLQFMYALGVD